MLAATILHSKIGLIEVTTHRTVVKIASTNLSKVTRTVPAIL